MLRINLPFRAGLGTDDSDTTDHQAYFQLRDPADLLPLPVYAWLPPAYQQSFVSYTINDTALMSAQVPVSAKAPDLIDRPTPGDAETNAKQTPPVEWVVDPIVLEGIDPQTLQSSSLIRLTNMRADPRFAGIDGSGFSVVIIDTGADLNHPAFGPDSNGDGVANRIVFQFDFTGSNDGDATDTKGHGTHVAGIIGSQNSAYPGMAPGANLIILKVFPDVGGASSTDIEEAVQWVVNNAATYNIVSVNLSLGVSNSVFNSPQTTYLSNEFQALINLGVAPVVAAGNDFFGVNSTPGVSTPAADSFAWAVGAVWDANVGQQSGNGAIDFTTGPDRITAFSQRTTAPGMLDIFAPGGAINNAYLGDSTAVLSGTSMAAPHIAGIVALAQEYAVQLSGSRLPVNTLLNLMRSSATTIIDGDDENDNVTNTGGSYPRVDVFALMEAIANHLGGSNNPGSVSINDVTITEGNSGTQLMNFTVTRAGGTAAFTVNYATAANTASGAAGDYVATSGTISFGVGVNTSTVSITINGDTSIEPNETFFVNLSGATNGATITDGQGQGTIINDDGGAVAGSVSINDVAVTEGNGGTTTATFTVTRTGGTAPFTVNFQTADGTATAGSDYVTTSGTLSFGSGVTTQTVTVTVNGNTIFEPNETFFVNLSGATNGAIVTDPQGQGTIVNDDPAPGADDFADSFTDVSAPFGQATVGGTATGNLETIGDRDWFRVTFTAGTTVRVELLGADTSNGTLVDPLVRLYNSAGTAIAEDDDSGTGFNSQLSYVVPVSGTYYVAAGAYSDGYLGTYTVRVTAGAGDDYADSFTDTTSPFGRVNVGSSTTGSLEVAGDRDWLRVTLTAGIAFTISLDGIDTNAGTLSDPYLRLYNAAGTLLTEDDDSGSGLNSQLTFTPTTSGTYFVAAGAFSDGYAGTYRVSVATSTPVSDDFRDSLTDFTAPFGSIAVNGTGTGNLEIAGDRDWFQVQLTAGKSYVVDLNGQDAGAGTLADPYLRVRNSSGTLIAESDDISIGVDRDSRLSFTATTTGTYYLETGAFDDDFVGTYRLSVSEALPPTAGTHSHDFNGDGRSDFLWQNNNGTPAVWLISGLSSVGGATLGNPGAAWREKDAGDFNGDGLADILWQNNDGTPAVWLMAGLTPVGGATLSNPGAAWHVIAAEDFNGDGKSDILWQNNDGTPAVWLMNGLTPFSGATLGNPGAAWHIIDGGDFNGDGKADILWQHNDGTTAVWLMNGLNLVGGAGLGNPGTAWHAIAAADFNGDGKDDILWQNNDGMPAVWLMNGFNLIAGAGLGNPGAAWHVIDADDFNGDGKADILWQHNDGTTAVWLMNGLNLIGGAGLGNPGADWHLVG